MSKQRAFKLQEFSAHEGPVNSLRLGHKSGRVLVTGGEDRKVNVWAIGKNNAIMSLSGHTSSVECVAFDATEEVVVAGSAGGTLKLWDLSEKKVVRTLNGHKSNVTAVEYHPCGEFFASGSQDTDLKIWDVRRKGCIQTYRGHTKGINIVRFSPDGRWVVSGGEDGKVKVWDLTVGRLMHELTHSGPITSLDFHPNEFLLASGGKDGVVNFWDLELFVNVSACAADLSIDTGAQGVFSLVFTPDGKALLSGYHQGLRAWSWEPATCLDTLPTDWSGLTDMTIVNGQLVGCAKKDNVVSVWAMNLSRMRLVPELAPMTVNTSRFIPKKNFEPVSFPNFEQEEDFPAQISPPPVSSGPIPASSSNSSALPPSVSTRNPKPYPITTTTTTTAAPTAVSKKNNKPTPQLHTEDFIVDTAPPQQTKHSSPSDIGPSFEDFRIGPDATPLQVFTQLGEPHDSVHNILLARLSHLKDVRSVWTSRGGDSKAVLEAVNTIKAIDKNTAVMVDFLSVVSLREDVFTLDFAVAVFPTLTDLLSSSMEGHVIIALALVVKLVKNFGPVIRATRETQAAKGVDLSYEERLKKCESCHSSLSYIRDVLLPGMVRRGGRVGVHSRELANLMKTYVSD